MCIFWFASCKNFVENSNIGGISSCLLLGFARFFILMSISFGCGSPSSSFFFYLTNLEKRTLFLFSNGKNGMLM